MSASIDDKITDTSSGVRPVSTTVSTLRNTGSTTLACADLTGWPTDSAVHFATYSVDAQGKIVTGSQTDWKGIVSGSNITNLTVTGGSDGGNSVGDYVILLPTAAWGADLFTGLTATLNQVDGTLKSSIVTTSKINDGAVTTAKLASAAVTSAKLSITKTTDAAGWTVRDFGSYKTYAKVVQISTGAGSIGSGTYQSYSVSDRPTGYTTSTLSMMTAEVMWGITYSNNAPFFTSSFEGDTTLFVRNISGAGANLPTTIYVHMEFKV